MTPSLLLPFGSLKSMTLSSKNRLILFTRYPEAGKTKTRLIPYLGAERAAHLQRQMTEHIVATTRPLRVKGSLSMEVHFSGGALEQMQDWLGAELTYRPQCEGDLGYRLQAAIADGFRMGWERIAIIGADCPEISPHHLEQTFHQLESHDVVLGPAQDGGYYLVGVSRVCAELFQGIAWGTGQVFEQTVAIAKRLNLSLTTLETLRDVDRPEDIAVFEQLPAFAAF